MQGFVPRSELSTERLESLEHVFFLGQVVKCKVLQFSVEQQRLTLTFKIDRTPFGSKVQLPEDFQIGGVCSSVNMNSYCVCTESTVVTISLLQITECNIIKRSDKGFDVELLPSKLIGLLPKMQLSDSVKLCEMLHNTMPLGYRLAKVMYISCHNVIVSFTLNK